MNEVCFEKCLPKPGSSVSSGEQKCFTSCMEVRGKAQVHQRFLSHNHVLTAPQKSYMQAWNLVNAAYIQRIRQEQSGL